MTTRWFPQTLRNPNLLVVPKHSFERSLNLIKGYTAAGKFFKIFPASMGFYAKYRILFNFVKIFNSHSKKSEPPLRWECIEALLHGSSYTRSPNSTFRPSIVSTKSMPRRSPRTFLVFWHELAEIPQILLHRLFFPNVNSFFWKLCLLEMDPFICSASYSTFSCLPEISGQKQFLIQKFSTFKIMFRQLYFATSLWFLKCIDHHWSLTQRFRYFSTGGSSCDKRFPPVSSLKEK